MTARDIGYGVTGPSMCRQSDSQPVRSSPGQNAPCPRPARPSPCGLTMNSPGGGPSCRTPHVSPWRPTSRMASLWLRLSPSTAALSPDWSPARTRQSTYLGDAILRVADQFDWPVVLDMRSVDWIDSGACAVLIKFWKELRRKGRSVTLCVTDPVRETFRITGLVRLIPCFGELGPAIEAARSVPPPEAVGNLE